MVKSNRKDPEYDFEEFRKACRKKQNTVFILPKAQKDAWDFFNLRTRTQLLDFISNHGLEELKFINKKKWEKNPDKQNVVMVDAYEFRSRFKLGYIAFMYNPKTQKWIIKSFHPSENTNPTMMFALAKAGLLTQEKSDG